MPVKLDWEIDDVDAPLPDIEETSRGTGCHRWWWRLLALTVLAAAIGLGYLGLKLRQKKSEIEDQLRAVVELELSAFVNNDRDLYLAQQAPHSIGWGNQEAYLDDYHIQVKRSEWDETWAFAQYTSQVPVVRVEGDQGWALVEVARGESVWREMWFYQWTKSDGWRHVRLDPDWLGDEQERVTPHLRLAYPERDEDIVAALADEMEGWYKVLAPLFGVNLADSDPPLLTIRFVAHDSPYRPGRVELSWTICAPRTLLAPSPHQSRFSADNTPGPELRQSMAGGLVEALIAYQSGLCPDATPPVEINALRHELRDWTLARLARTWPDLVAWNTFSTPLVDALVAREDLQVIPQLAANLNGPETLDQVLAAANLDPPDPVARFAFLLVAGNRARRDRNLHDYQALADPQADRTWRDYRTEQWDWQSQEDTFDIAWPPLQVKSVVFNGEVAWVEAEATWPGGSLWRQAHFFRQAGERWLLTSPDPAYLGQARTIQTENLTFNYFERDAPWFEGDLPAKLQAALDQAAVDLNLPTGHFIFTVDIDSPGLYGWSSGSNVIKLASPSLTNWSLDQPDELVANLAYPLLDLSSRLDSMNTSISFGHPGWAVQNAIVQWEIQRLFPARADSFRPSVGAAQVATLSMDDLGAPMDFDLALQQQRRFQDSYRTLIEYLAETYGPEAIAALLGNLSQPGGLEAWLLLSTGHNVDEIEPGWRAWVMATYGEQ